MTTGQADNLSGLAADLAGVTIRTLPGSGTVTTTVAIDRAAKTRTVSTSRTDCTLPEISINTNGQGVSQTTNQSAIPTVRHYDGLGRVVIEISPLSAVTRTAWNEAGQIESGTDQFNHSTRFIWWEAGTPAAGRLKTETNALGKTTSHTWSTRGEHLTTTGTASYPVTYTYDDHGDLHTQTTWRGTGTAAVAETTTWQRAPNSGILLKRINADTTESEYAWHANGKPHTRERESGATTTWTWNDLGNLTAIDYTGDGNRTPDVAITAHTRLGQPVTITQNGIGAETLMYHPGRGTQASHTYAPDHTLLPGKQISWAAPDAYGQPSGFTPSDGPAVAYDWDEGLLHTVSTTLGTHTYGYRPNSAMVQSVTANNYTADTFVQSYPRDIAGRLLAASSAVPGSTPTQLTRHGYRLDDLNRRTRATLLDGSTWAYGYNDRSEVTAATRKQPDGTEVPALGAAYNYDDIGNRLTSTSPILGNFGYSSNSANQYSAITSNDSRTVLGNAPANAAVTVNSAPASRAGTLFQKTLTADNSTNPHYLQAAVTDGTSTQTRHVYLPAASTAPTYDLDGNLTNDGQWIYTWDAENRLVSMETTPAAVTTGRPFRKLTFAYDWTNHRLARTITDSANTILSATRWLYDGWNPIAEYTRSVGVSPTLSKTYLWGIDLSGTLQGAGGVGGLLAAHIHDPQSAIYHPSFDGNGNITAWTQSGTTTPTNRREYDAFGNVVVEQGTPPCAMGFSTKLEDPETGLLYYGHRYYSPLLGRWINQDPIEERGGLNLYGFVGNGGLNRVDYLGYEEPWVAIGNTPPRLQPSPPKPGDTMNPDMFSGLTNAEKEAWTHAFRDRFGDAINRSSEANCIPKKLLAAMIANEMMVFGWPDGTSLDGSGGGGIGPAQISVDTAIEYGLTDITSTSFTPWIDSNFCRSRAKARYRNAIGTRLAQDDGSVEAAARLLSKYIEELCSMKQGGSFGAGFTARFKPDKCSFDHLCCVSCKEKIDADIPDCFIDMMAAKWNTPGVVNAKDPIGDHNFPNADSNGANASSIIPAILEGLTK